MERNDKVAREYPFIMLANMLLNFDYSTGILKYNGENISVNKIRNVLNIQTYYRVDYSLKVLERYKLCKVIKTNGNKFVRLSSKIVRCVKKIESEVECQ